MKQVLLITLAGFIWVLAATPTLAILVAGDLAFVGYDSDGKNFAVVALEDIPIASVVYFNDNEWDGSSSFNTGEGTLTWNTGASLIAAGTVIDFSNINVGSVSADFGTVVRDGSFNISGSNESLWAYLGTDSSTPTEFLAVITNEDDGSSAPNLGSTGLVGGLSAQLLDGDEDVMNFTGATSGQAAFGDYLSSIGDPSNWTTFDGSGSQSASYAPPTEFSVTAIPEPTAFLFGSLIASVMGLTVARRRA